MSETKTPSARTLRRHARAAGIPPQPTGRKAPEGARHAITIRLAPGLRAWIKAESARLGVTETAIVEEAVRAKCAESKAFADS